MPVTVTGITNATAVIAGIYHSCALLPGGSIKCWGTNSSGELGDGRLFLSATPVSVVGISGVPADLTAPAISVSTPTAYTVDAPALGGTTPGGTTPGGSTPSGKLAAARIRAPSRAKRSALRRGVSVSLASLKPGSTVAVRVRVGSRTLAAYQTKADASGEAKLTIKLVRKQLKTLFKKTLSLRYSLTAADGTATTIAKTLKVT